MAEPELVGPGRPTRPDRGVATFAAVGMVLVALYVGRDIFIPVALAILLSFLLYPLVLWLRRRRLPRMLAVLIVVGAAFSAAGWFFSVMIGQVAHLAEDLPQYQRNLQSKIAALRNAGSGDVVFERVGSMLHTLRNEIENGNPPASPAQPDTRPQSQRRGAAPVPLPAQSDPQKPLQVEIRNPDPAPLALIQQVLGPLLAPVGNTLIVLVVVVFLLVNREDFRDRLIRLAGARDLHRTTIALDDAAQRLTRYLTIQAVVNAVWGTLIGLGLYAIGVPNAALWGVLGILLRFVTFLGPILAAIVPLVLAIAVDPGWEMVAWTAALFIGLEAVTANLIEPMLFGANTGLSPLAVVLSAIFWTWLWGSVGLLLSTPLTVCLSVLGRHVPHLDFLDVLLGNKPVLTPAETFYQRLLAQAPDDATDQAEAYLQAHAPAVLVDQVMLPALGYAEQDRARGVLDAVHRAHLVDGVKLVLDNLEADDGTENAARPSPNARSTGLILCAAGRSELDEAAARLSRYGLARAGHVTDLADAEQLAPAMLPQLEIDPPSAVCISYLGTGAVTHARYLVRRLKRRWPQARMIVAFWGLSEPIEALGRRQSAIGCDAVVTSMNSALAAMLMIDSERFGLSATVPAVGGGEPVAA